EPVLVVRLLRRAVRRRARGRRRRTRARPRRRLLPGHGQPDHARPAVQRAGVEGAGGGVTFLEQRSWDQLRGRTETTWTFVRPDGERSELAFSVRLYTAPELVAMLASAGLDLDGVWGGWEGEELAAGHRILLRARKVA